MKAILIAVALVAAQSVSAQEAQYVDTWGGARAHVLVSAAIGATLYTAAPQYPYAAFGACLLPGLHREITKRNDPGNGFSKKDMISNSLGCALGMSGSRLMLGKDWVGMSIKF